ncbi:MAG TPA: sugar phosphate nucleotidyltransferase, partial [Chitinophagaceae bacterium]|nr:sugar phosphate nucleotidyltransferase [Chitinophagaceae bacterium]
GFVDVLAAEQTPENTNWFEGTADAVRKSLHHFIGHEYDYILILSGDQLYSMNFNKMLREHIDKKAEVSIATTPVNSQDAPGFGIMKTNKEECIESFVEKPDSTELDQWESEVSKEMKKKGRKYLASMGIYIFNKSFLKEILATEAQATDFGKEIIPKSIEKFKVISFQYEGYWTDIGTVNAFFDANLNITEAIPHFNLFNPFSVVYTRARMLPPTKVLGTTLERASVADGCIIMASRLEHTVVGIRTRIGKGTTVINSYIMGSNLYEDLDQLSCLSKKGMPAIGIGERCYINNAIIDRNVRIGNDVRINGGTHLDDTDEELYTVRDGIVVVKKDVTLPNGFTI